MWRIYVNIIWNIVNKEPNQKTKSDEQRVAADHDLGENIHGQTTIFQMILWSNKPSHNLAHNTR